ncbi:hypothetical protein PROFUN_07712 [Planoprotostelium fungivorum]|uniref:Transmembrane protein n=1 Tax=Planoprotostelium fungivorum TaxID=1890364 RepID=A0A2P6N1I4_9EUKA|nr:hypothetical protein PROFUN_07712 [Planoprotostelium fungivorum]
MIIFFPPRLPTEGEPSKRRAKSEVFSFILLGVFCMGLHLFYLYDAFSYVEEIKGLHEPSDQMMFLWKMSTIHTAQKVLTTDYIFSMIFFAFAAMRDIRWHCLPWIFMMPIISLAGTIPLTMAVRRVLDVASSTSPSEKTKELRAASAVGKIEKRGQHKTKKQSIHPSLCIIVAWKHNMEDRTTSHHDSYLLSTWWRNSRAVTANHLRGDLRCDFRTAQPQHNQDTTHTCMVVPNVAVFYSLGSIYLVLAVVSFSLLLKTFLREDVNQKFKILPRIVYCAALVFCSERGALCFVIPGPFLFGITRDHRWLIVLIDMLPEVLAFSVYLLLLFFVTTATRAHRDERLRLHLWYLFGFIISAPLVAVLIYSALESRFANPPPWYANWDYHVQTSIVCVMTGFLVIAFCAYGILLYKSLGKFIHSTNKARLHILVVTCTLSSTAHAVMNAVFNENLRNDPNRDTKAGFYLAWAAVYFALTEALPFACILGMFSTLFRTERKRDSHRMSEIPSNGRSRASTTETLRTMTDEASRTVDVDGEEAEFVQAM